MKKEIIIIVTICAVSLIGFFLFSQKKINIPKNSSIATSTQASDSESASTTVNTVKVSPQGNLGGTVKATSKDIWGTFVEYLARAKAHDVKGVEKLSYSLSDTCKDPKQEKECFAKMDAVYEIGSTLKKEDFINVWEDNKQGILTTSIRRPDTIPELIAMRAAIFFTKDAQGNPKLLALNPNEMWRVRREKASTTEELEAKISSLTKDTDQDGVSDDLENCIFPDNIIPISCVKTNPNKRDSNGNGWWDGLEPMLSQ